MRISYYAAKWTVVLLFTVSVLASGSASAAVHCAVMGYKHYQDGYIHQLQAKNIDYDALSGQEFKSATLKRLLKYHAIFIALGIDRIGIDSAYRKKLSLYVKSGGVLVLEQKARMELGPVVFSGKLPTHKFHVTAASEPWFNKLSPEDSIAYAGYLYTLKPSENLTAVAKSNGKPVMGFGKYGRGWVFYSGASSGFDARSGENKPYVQLVKGTIDWALSRHTTRKVPKIIQQVNAAMKNPSVIPASKDWIWNMRIISIEIPDHPSERAIIRQALKYKKQGVNTIMDHGSFQFVPGLPDSSDRQWKMQVHYQAAKAFTDALHKAGLRVIHHTTSTFIPIEAMNNPKYHFFSRDIRTGEVALRPKGTAYDDAVFADMNSSQFRSIIFPRMQKYMRLVRPDAFMTDEVEWLPDIYAGGARASRIKFRQEYGFDYPSGDQIGDWQSPVWRAYVKFRFDSGGDFFRSELSVLRKENPDVYLASNLAGISGYWKRGWAQGSQSWLAGLNLLEYEGEQGTAPHPKAGGGFLYASVWPTYYREMSLYGAAAAMNNTVTFELAYPQTWKIPNSEQFYCWAQASLMGMRYWMRDYQAEPQWYAWEAKHEKDLIRPKWINDIGIFYPEYSKNYKPNTKPVYKDWSGISEALAQYAVQADQLMRWQLSSYARLKRFKLLIIPSAHFLSPQIAKNLDRFVRQGGILIVTADSAVNGLLKPADKDGTFSKLVGVRPVKWISGDANTVITTNTGLIPKGSYPFEGGYQRVRLAKGAKVLSTISGSNDPAIVVHYVGQGKVIYFAGRIGGEAFQTARQRKLPHFTVDANMKLRRQLADLVASLLKDRRRVQIVGLPSDIMTHAHATFGHGKDNPRLTIHFLDSTGGYKNGEPWHETAQPLQFIPIAKRTNGQPIHIILRDISGIKAVKVISPSYQGRKKLKVQYNRKMNGYMIKVPAQDMGRYSVVVVTPTTASFLEGRKWF